MQTVQITNNRRADLSPAARVKLPAKSTVDVDLVDYDAFSATPAWKQWCQLGWVSVRDPRAVRVLTKREQLAEAEAQHRIAGEALEAADDAMACAEKALAEAASKLDDARQAAEASAVADRRGAQATQAEGSASAGSRAGPPPTDPTMQAGTA